MDFTNGELKLMFQRIEEKLDEIKHNMNAQHARYDAEIASLRVDIKHLQETDEKLNSSLTKIMTIGGTVWSAVTLFGVFILQRILN